MERQREAPRERTPRDDAGEDMSLMTVFKRHLNYLLGRNGERLRWVERNTGTFVFVAPDSSWWNGQEIVRVVICSAKYENRTNARLFLSQGVEAHELELGSFGSADLAVRDYEERDREERVRERDAYERGRGVDPVWNRELYGLRSIWAARARIDRRSARSLVRM